MNNLISLLAKENQKNSAYEKMKSIIFDIIFQHIQDMVFIMKADPSGFTYIFVNEAGLRNAGLSANVIGRSIQEALPLHQAHLLLPHYDEVLKGKKTLAFSSEFFPDTGGIFYGETILTPIIDGQEVRYIIAVTRDVTETVKEKQELVESEQRFRSIVENNMDAIFSLSLDGQILYSNPAASKLTGFTEKQIAYRSFYDFIADPDISTFRDLLVKAEAGYALETMDCRLIHRKGFLLTMSMKTVPIVIDEEVKGLYVIGRDVTEQARNAETIKFMAFHDQLTGLLNRRALLDHLNEEIQYSKKQRNEFALISIDLDRFKFLNDSLGHLAGDEILKKVAGRLIDIQNQNGKVYRQGGDEFNFLLTKTNRKGTALFAQKILSQFTDSFYLNSNEYYISPSIGISIYPNDGRDAETLIKNADEALYRVKKKGKAHYQFYRSEMNAVLTNIVNLETNLRKAIDREELKLYFQPQFNLRTQEIKSFEALLRWNSPELGNIPPGDFIPLAEDTGLIVPIGHWVIETACRQIRKWNDKGYKDIRVAVNISPKQFQQPSFAKSIQARLEKYRLNPSSLEIEITEGAMRDTKETIPILKRLREMGVTISIDDFGTGYSSLNYLKESPIDVLKIDQSFVRDILINEKNAAITSTIIHLGQSLGMEVIAEGVETKQQADFLIKANCHKVQGYYYGKPLPEYEAEGQFLIKK